VTVEGGPVNHPPEIVSAAWAEPNPVTLPGGTTAHVVASDSDGDPLGYAWGQAAGPGTASFATPAAADSGVTFDVPGSYVLRVTIDDGNGGTVWSDVTVVVEDAAKPGDLDGDGVVNAIDLQIVVSSFGRAVADPGCDPRADANGDTVVNALDLQIVVADFGMET
jgi:hypothetical protein